MLHAGGLHIHQLVMPVDSIALPCLSVYTHTHKRRCCAVTAAGALCCPFEPQSCAAAAAGDTCSVCHAVTDPNCCVLLLVSVMLSDVPPPNTLTPPTHTQTQVLLSDRGWGTLLSLGASILYTSTFADWRPSWRQQQYKAPWWQAGLVTVVPTLVTRSISRLGIGWVFLLPVRLLATLLGYPGRLLLGLVRVPLAHGLGAVVVVAPSAAAAVWPGWALRAGASVVCRWVVGLWRR